MGHFRKHKKQFLVIPEETFIDCMNRGHFCREGHRAFCSALYYFGVRISELLRAKREQFFERKGRLYFDVGPRLKRGLHTAPLYVPLDRPFAHTLLNVVEETRKGKRVFPWCRKTGYNIVDRAFDTYPHHFRLSRATYFLEKGFSIIKVKNWMGHRSLKSLDFYAGTVDIEELGEA